MPLARHSDNHDLHKRRMINIEFSLSTDKNSPICKYKRRFQMPDQLDKSANENQGVSIGEIIIQ
jgi:hypothetical protein